MSIKSTTLLFFFILCSLNVYSQKVTYFDWDNKKISQKKFNKSLICPSCYEIPENKPNHRVLINRKQEGFIKNRNTILELIKKETGFTIADNQTLVVLYHYDMNPCLEGGQYEKNWMIAEWDFLKHNIERITGGSPILFYKNRNGLKGCEDIKECQPDPHGLFEELFFQHNYPCGSFVVINSKGEYMSYLGEFETSWLFGVTTTLTNIK